VFTSRISGALRHDYCTETFVQCYLYTMNPILQNHLVFNKLNWFMMSYFGLCIASEKKYVTGNIAKPGGLLHRGRIATLLQLTPVLVVTKT